MKEIIVSCNLIQAVISG